MTASLTPQQTWKQLSAGTSLSGSGVFGFTGAHKSKGGSNGSAASTTGTIADPSLSFNKLFANDLSKNALSETDPSAEVATQDSSTRRSGTTESANSQSANSQSGTASPTADARSGSDDASALSGPLASGLVALLLGLATAANQGTAGDPTGDDPTGAATAAAGSDATAAVQTASSVTADSGSDDATESLQDLLDELDQFAGMAGGGMTDDMTAYDDLPSAGDETTITDASSQSSSQTTAQAAALLEMQKALTAYFSGSLTNSQAATAATSIAI